MKTTFSIWAAASILFFGWALAKAESNSSLEALTNAETAVQLKLKQFAKANANYQLLLSARKVASSRNPRGDNKTTLSALDEGSLRLQLKVLLALAEARDPHFDRHAATNAASVNVVPPLTNGDGLYAAGMDPKGIQDPEARKAYEDAIAKNHRRKEKHMREREISHGVDYALIDIWVFVKRGLPENSAAQNRAIEIVTHTLSDKSILDRFNSSDMPGLIW
jgi:hypothetical protein